jgi:hypothetical protein
VGTNIVFKKSLILEYGGFDTNLGMKGDQISYHEDTKIVFKALQDNKKVYYSNEMTVQDQLPAYKKSILFYIYSKYKAGFDWIELRPAKAGNKDLFNLLELINQTMDELNVAILRRDKEKYAYPENYVMEKVLKKFFKIGLQVRYFLDEKKTRESIKRNCKKR